jgi:hypothetical protein
MDDKMTQTNSNVVKSVADPSQRDPIPETFDTIEEMAEFWDSHDSGDYEDCFGEEVEFEIDLPPRPGKRIILAVDLADKLGEVAKQQGVSTETLANLWLQEKLVQTVG